MNFILFAALLGLIERQEGLEGLRSAFEEIAGRIGEGGWLVESSEVSVLHLCTLGMVILPREVYTVDLSSSPPVFLSEDLPLLGLLTITCTLVLGVDSNGIDSPLFFILGGSILLGDLSGCMGLYSLRSSLEGLCTGLSRPSLCPKAGRVL